jgi:hypothetical protein
MFNLKKEDFMDFIFTGKIGQEKKKEIMEIIISTLKRLVSSETIGKHHLEYYNIAFIQADIQNAQGQDVIFMDFISQLPANAIGKITEPFRDDPLDQYKIQLAQGKHV